MKRTVSLVTAFFAMIVLQAQTPTNLPTDTLVRDLSDLEEKMQAESITAKADTTYYGTPKQRNFNALDYSLDSRHRYQGDKWTKGGFSKHTFLDLVKELNKVEGIERIRISSIEPSTCSG